MCHQDVNPNGEKEHLQICKIYHNRDKNAAKNMLLIIEELKKTFTIYKRSRRGNLNSFPFHDGSEVFIFLEAKLTLADITKYL